MKKILWMTIVGLMFFASSCKNEVPGSGEPEAPVAPDNSGEVINDSVFHFTALADGTKIKLKHNEGAPTVSLKYAVYTGGSYSGWATYSAGKTITLFHAGDKLYFKAAVPNRTFANSGNENNMFLISDSASVGGNIMYLLKSDGTVLDFAAGQRYQCAFMTLFSRCETLTSADSLILPADKLPAYCYTQMFYGCTNLRTAPALPATTLASSCYNGMFASCINLQSVTMLATNGINADCLGNWLMQAGVKVDGKKYVYVAAEEGGSEYENIRNSLPDSGNGDWQLAQYVHE